MFLIRVIIVLGIMWLLAAFIGWMIRQALLKHIHRVRDNMHKKAPPKDKRLVACQVCATFVDKDNAIYLHDKAYCSKEHLQQDNEG